MTQMNPDIKALWLEALRSGEYKQGVGVLHNETEDTYCCLGVLCDVAIKQGVNVETTTLERHGGLDDEREVTAYGDEAEYQILPTAVKAWAGMTDSNPSVRIEPSDPDYPDADDLDADGKVEASLAELNDGDASYIDHRFSFAEIADVIEASL